VESFRVCKALLFQKAPEKMRLSIDYCASFQVDAVGRSFKMSW
jgi:hypothetical protein